MRSEKALAGMMVVAVALLAVLTFASIRWGRPATRWEFADLIMEQRVNGYGMPISFGITSEALGLSVIETGDGAYGRALKAAQTKLGGAGSLQNRIAERGWEPYAFTREREGESAVERHLFRRPIR